MRKTSIYLDDALAERIRRTAERTGKSQAKVIRDAIAEYTEKKAPPKRQFTLAGIADCPGLSAADLTEEELLEGFGE